ncbi:hypothetical protein MMC30_002747 [Trapelia coarctata]|nr:hypothetical protein [Trapelia coarctata]
MSSRFLPPVLILACCLFLHHPSSALAVPLEIPFHTQNPIPGSKSWPPYPGVRERDEGRIHPRKKRSPTPTDPDYFPGFPVPPTSTPAAVPPWLQNLLSNNPTTPSVTMSLPQPPAKPSSVRSPALWPIDPHEEGLSLDRPGNPPPSQKQALLNLNTSKRLREQMQEDTIRRARKLAIGKSPLGRPNMPPIHEKRTIHHKRSPMESPPNSPPNSPPKSSIEPSSPNRHSRSNPSSPHRRPHLYPSLPRRPSPRNPNPHPPPPIKIPPGRKSATAHAEKPDSPPALVGSAPAWAHKFDLIDFKDFNPAHEYDIRHGSGTSPSSGAGPSHGVAGPSRLSAGAGSSSGHGAGLSDAVVGLPRSALLTASGRGGRPGSPVRGSSSPPRSARPPLPRQKSSKNLSALHPEGAAPANPALSGVRSAGNLHGLSGVGHARPMGRRPRANFGKTAGEGGSSGSLAGVSEDTEAEAGALGEMMANVNLDKALGAGEGSPRAAGGVGGRVRGGLGQRRAGAGAPGGREAPVGEAVRGGQLAGVGGRGGGIQQALAAQEHGGGQVRGGQAVRGGAAGGEDDRGQTVGYAVRQGPKRPREETDGDGDTVMGSAVRRRIIVSPKRSPRGNDAEAGPSGGGEGERSLPRSPVWDTEKDPKGKGRVRWLKRGVYGGGGFQSFY